MKDSELRLFQCVSANVQSEAFFTFRAGIQNDKDVVFRLCLSDGY